MRMTTEVAWQALRANPLRTLLATTGVIVGTGALVSVLSLADGVESYARKQISATTDLHSIVVAINMFDEVDGQRFPRASFPRITPDDELGLTQALGAGSTVAAQRSARAIVTIGGDSTRRGAALLGVTPAFAKLRNFTMRAGTFVTDAHVAQAAPVAVISAWLADTLHLEVGAQLLLNGAPFEVAGIATTAAGEGARGQTIVVPLTSLDRAIARAPDVLESGQSFHVRIDSVEHVSTAQEAVTTWSAARYGSDWRNVVSVSDQRGRLAQVQQALLVFRILLGAITGVSLFVGGIGIMNVLLANIAERTREIGIRRAAGARRRDILRQVLTESVAITMSGGAFGVVLGVAVAFLAAAIMRARTEAVVYAGLSASTLATALGATFVLGMAFGVYPALRASRMQPVDALRYE